MDSKLFMEDRLLRLNQIIGQKEVSSEVAMVNKAKAAAIRKEFPAIDPNPKVRAKQEIELSRKLAKVGPRTRRPKIKAIIPVSKSSWHEGVASGKYPKPIRIDRVTFWRESDVLALMKRED
jgi:predicted DNA-binding transcriptional regulator AlpA